MKRLITGMVIVAMLLSMGAAIAQEGLEVDECWTDRVCMSGYFQVRFVDEDARTGDSNFDLRRGFFTIKGDLDARSTGIITFARVGPYDPDITIYNAFVDYRFDDQFAVQAGQVPTWFGLEAWEGSSVRLPFERAKILEGGRGGNLGFWWQGASDRGVWFRRAPQSPEEPLIVAGVCNGQFRSDDLNSDKNFSLDVKFNRDWGQFGASWLDGSYQPDRATPATDRSAVALYARKFAAPWGAQVEWVDGKMLGADRDGWYLQGMFDLEDGKNIAFARYEEYNASVDAANKASYDGWTIGVQHRVYDSGYITVQYTNGDWSRTGTVDGFDTSGSENLFGVQWQYEYR